jgi:hemolysin III
MERPAGKKYTLGEEIANSVTHGFGAALGVAALSILVIFAAQHGDVWRVVSFSVYGSSLILLYVASTLYHAIQNDKAKKVFRLFDYVGIFLLIAGTYTPFTLITFRGALGWTIFGLIWGIAIVGIVLTMVFFDRLRILLILTFMAMGWMVLFAIKPMIASLPTGGIVWLAAGGLTYTLGMGFYAWRRLPYHHAIWHLFVLGGSACHFFCILFYVLPVQSV